MNFSNKTFLSINGQAKIQLLPEFKKQHKLYPTQKSNGINLFMYESFANN